MGDAAAVERWLTGLRLPAELAAGERQLAPLIAGGALDGVIGPAELASWSARLTQALASADSHAAPVAWDLVWRCWALCRQTEHLLPDRELDARPPTERTTALRQRAGVRLLLAQALDGVRHPAAAARLFRHAAGDAFAADDVALAGQAVLGEAGCRLAMGQALAASDRYRTAQHLLGDGPPASYAAALLGEATCLRSLDQPAAALPRYAAAGRRLAAADLAGTAMAARCLANHASCLADLGQHTLALTLFDAAAARLATHNLPVERAACLMNWATCLHERGDVTAAYARYREAMRLCERLGPAADDVRWRVAYDLAALSRPAGDWTRAHRLLVRALPALEQATRRTSRVEDQLSLRASSAQVYRLAVETALNLAAVEPDRRAAHERTAFALAQAAKGRVLATLLMGALTPPAFPAKPDAALSRLHGSLADDELLLDCLALEERLAIFAVTPRRGLVVHQVERTALAAAVGALRDSMRRARAIVQQGGLLAGRPDPVLARLYDLLLAPLARQGLLDGVRHLIVAPAAPLHQVPFPALWRPSGQGARFLTEDVWLSTIPMAAALPALRARPDRPAQPPALLAVAPFADAGAEHAGSLPALPASAAEVAQIARQVRQRWPETPATVLTGAHATRTAVLARLATARLLVAATHGLPGEGGALPDFGLAFAGAPATGSVLRLRSILDGSLPLGGTFQVTLSACHLGQVQQQGDEPLGFVHALLAAGAQLCLAPVWAVDDGATTQLSVAYHQALLAGQPAAAAHQQAMATVRATPGLAHPYRWAGWLLAGDGRRALPLPKLSRRPAAPRQSL